MSETSDTISAGSLPLDPPPRPIDAPPNVNPNLRRNLMFVGANFSLVMAAKNKMPEQVAQETGLPLEVIEQVRAGTEPDIGVRALSAICTLLGLPFHIAVGSPPPGAAGGGGD